MLNTISQQKCFDGMQTIYSHESQVLGCNMRFAVYTPPGVSTKTPVLFWLSGLTCTEENFIIKSGAQRVAAELGVTLIAPDTSPRNIDIPGVSASYDFGIGAGFYLNATEEPWSRNFQMYSYITEELFSLVRENCQVDLTRAGIFGHSMGGHGALTIALKNPHKFKSVSAFAPICSPIQSPWGQNAFQKYLGNDHKKWLEYDAVALIEQHGWKGPSILIDQGTADIYIDSQLKPELLREACQQHNVALNLRLQKGYDHSYYFISSFMEDHIKYHLQYLN